MNKRDACKNILFLHVEISVSYKISPISAFRPFSKQRWNSILVIETYLGMLKIKHPTLTWSKTIKVETNGALHQNTVFSARERRQDIFDNTTAKITFTSADAKHNKHMVSFIIVLYFTRGKAHQ